MTEVFLCEKGQLTDPAKHDLRKAGIVVAEVNDVTRCQFIRSSEVVAADDMVWACLDALNRSSGYDDGKHQREQLARNLLAIVDAARKKAAPKDQKVAPKEES